MTHQIGQIRVTIICFPSYLQQFHLFIYLHSQSRVPRETAPAGNGRDTDLA